MNKKAYIIIITIISAVIYGCSAGLEGSIYNVESWIVEKRINLAVKKGHRQTDTVYVYYIYRVKKRWGRFYEGNVMWFHKQGHIHSFLISTEGTKRLKTVEAKDISIDKGEIEKYFDDSIFKDIPCFEWVLDGEGVDVYVKGQERLYSGLDTRCLFKTRYKPNSFPYKLQYDLSKLGWGFIPKDFDFEKMYSEP